MQAAAGTWNYFAVVLLHALLTGDAVMFGNPGSDLTPASHAEPEFEPAVQNITFVTGSTASLTCTVRNLEHYKVAWIQEDSRKILTVHVHVITRDPRVSLLRSKNSHTLLIRDLRHEDSGAYHCQVNTSPVKTLAFFLHVADEFATTATRRKDIDADSGDKPEVTQVLPTAAILAGRTASLECNLKNSGAYEISWVNEDTGKVLAVGRNLITNDSRVSLRPETNESFKLCIHDVRREDSGTYTCHLISDPKKKLHFVLLVIDTPAVSSTSIKLERENLLLVATLKCTVHGLPRPILYWSKDQNTLNSSGESHEIAHTHPGYGEVNTSLILRNVGVDDLGIYRCHAENSVGKQCARFRISKDIINSVVMESSGIDTPKAITEDEGIFGRRAEGARPTSPPNDPETLTASANVDIVDRNVGLVLNTSAKNITAKLGETVALNCSVKNLGPYLVMWSRDKVQRQRLIAAGSVIVVPSQRYSVMYDAGDTHTLLIKDVRYEDSGIYSCFSSATQMQKLDLFINVVAM